MASAWASKLSVVTVPEWAPKPVTFVYPYYENPQFLARQLEVWHAYPAPLRKWLSFIVVDDGSPTSPAAGVLSSATLRIRLFRIERDVPWNWLAARNIGMFYANDGWCLLTDMDHVVPPETAERLVHGRHNHGVIYVFSRREHSGEPVNPHSASFLMTRDAFWSTGGYDEALSGHYGTDGEFRRRAMKVAPFQILTDALVRHEYQGDSSTTRYLRKQPADTAAVKRMVEARAVDWRPKTFSFPYHEVSL